MKRTGIALLSAAALLASAGTYAADATDISWTYLEGGWVSADGDDSNSTDGWAVNGSLGFLEHFYAQAGYSSLTSETDSTELGLDVDVDTWAITFGYHAPLTNNSVWFADIGYFDGNADLNGEDIDPNTDGINLSTGARIRPSENIEFLGALVYTDGDTDDQGDFNDTSVRLVGQYFIMPAWSVGVRASLSGSGGGAIAASGDSLTIFTRWSFGQVL